MKRMIWLGLALGLFAAGCGGDAPVDTSADEATTVEVKQEQAAAPAVEPTGTVIEVKMITDDKGNYFEPSEIEAKRGDVLKFVLVSGVHNVNFLPEKNPADADLPPASPMLQLPGQTHEIPVTMEAGEYYFQCDPHAALGMVGSLTVVE